MNTRIVNIIIAVVMSIAFFLPWVSLLGFAGSPFDAVYELLQHLDYVSEEPRLLLGLLFLIFPLCGVIVVFKYAKDQISVADVEIINWAKRLPLVCIIAVFLYVMTIYSESIRMLVKSGVSFTDIFEIGFFITVLTSIVLFFSKTRPQDFNAKP